MSNLSKVSETMKKSLNYWLFFVNILLHHHQKLFRRLGKDLIFFPDHIHFNLNGRRQGAKRKFAVTRSIDDTVKTDSVPQPFFHKQGSIEQQIISHNDVQLREAALHPLGYSAALSFLL